MHPDKPMVNFCNFRLTIRTKIDYGNTSPVPLRDFLRFVYCAVAAIWLLFRRGNSPNPAPYVAAWIVFRVVTGYFGLVSVLRGSEDLRLANP